MNIQNVLTIFRRSLKRLEKSIFHTRLSSLQTFVITGFGLLVPPAALAVEQPQYQIIDRIDDTIEIRAYPSMTQATSIVTGDMTRAGNTGFRRLAGYIFGGNDSGTKISMTSPVLQTQRQDTEFEIAFIMPADQVDNLPRPDDALVRIESGVTLTVAVLRYRGGWSRSRYEEHRDVLLQSLNRQHQWLANGDPVWARYDPPFKPAFLRTNEIMIPVTRSSTSEDNPL